MTTLLFPASTPLAHEYADVARRRGETVIAASSVFDALSQEEFGELIILPYVYDEAFHAQFTELVRVREVTQIYSPVASVYAFLEVFLAKEKLPVHLLGSSPIASQVEAYRKLLRKAQAAEAFIACCAHAPTKLSRLDIAAIFRGAAGIYGESNEEKLTAMMAVFASAPKGDVIEIGSLMGKSLFVMQHLARHYAVGPVLSVDPLSPATSIQSDSPQVALESMETQWDYGILRQAVVINLLPVSAGRFNYLRMEAEHGVEIYRKQRVISTPEFGEVSYAGKIALIHIDGNHDYRQVNKDCELWLPLLAPGAWLILDDYLWAHGDGPHRVGNALLEARWNDIERAFVCGKALFVKFK